MRGPHTVSFVMLMCSRYCHCLGKDISHILDLKEDRSSNAPLPVACLSVILVSFDYVKPISACCYRYRVFLSFALRTKTSLSCPVALRYAWWLAGSLMEVSWSSERQMEIRVFFHYHTYFKTTAGSTIIVVFGTWFLIV